LGSHKKIRCRACLAADSNLVYLMMILHRASASYAEANYNVDNNGGANIFFHHKVLILYFDRIIVINDNFVNRNIFAGIQFNTSVFPEPRKQIPLSTIK